MDKHSQEPAKILTEEELHEVGNLINELHYSRQISDQLHTEVENVLVSHRALNERNRMLVQENDDLNAGRISDQQELDFRVFLAQLPETFRQTAINAISIFGIVIEGVNDLE